MTFQKGSGITAGMHFYSNNYNIIVIIRDKRKEKKGKENPLTF